jgi:hypothetical protein
MKSQAPFARQIAAATAVDFTATFDNGFPLLPQAIEVIDGGTLVFTDGTGTQRTFTNLPAGWSLATEIRALSASTNTAVRVASNANAFSAPRPDQDIGPSRMAGVAEDAKGLAGVFHLRKDFTAGTTGSADDVTVLDSALFAFDILDAYVIVSTAKNSQTVTLRTATGGGGAALSSDMSVGSTGRVRNAGTSIPQVAANGAIYLRRSDRDCAGTVVLLCARP